MSHGVQPNLNDERNHGGSGLLNCNIPIRTGLQWDCDIRYYGLTDQFAKYRFANISNFTVYHFIELITIRVDYDLEMKFSVSSPLFIMRL